MLHVSAIFKLKTIKPNTIFIKAMFILLLANGLFPVLLGFNTLLAQQVITGTTVTGTLHRYVFADSLSRISPRNVDVWLPSNFDTSGKTKYAVLYVHDGQNLFNAQEAFGQTEWRLDEVLDSLQQLKLIRPTIAVGIWNSSKRFAEYNPEAPYKLLKPEAKALIDNERPGGALSDAYLDVVFNQIKPFIDVIYPTKASMSQTFMMGSSMGGLISLYALTKYPDRVKSVACLSTHWPLSLKQNTTLFSHTYQDYFIYKIPNPMVHQIYFDHGTEALDAWYEPHQQRMDSLCYMNGYNTAKSFLSIKFSNHAHNEFFWSKRLHYPLVFMLKP